MGLKNFLFGNNKEQYSTGQKQVILLLTGLRVSHSLDVQGYSKDEALKMTLELLQQQDFSGDKILSMPDVIVLKIIIDYIKLMSYNLDLANGRNSKLDLNELRKFVINTIDDHRNKTFGLPDSGHLPDDLDNYIFYRLQREVRAINKTDPEVLGYDRETVQLMINIVKESCQPRPSFLT